MVGFNQVEDCFALWIGHADGFSSSFVSRQKKKKQEEKIKATSPGLLRNGRSGAEKRTRSVSLRSNSIFQHRPTIPPLTPLRLGRSFIRQGASLLAFCFWLVNYSEKAALQYLLDGVKKQCDRILKECDLLTCNMRMVYSLIALFFRVFTDAIFVRCLYCFYLMPVTENKKLRLLSFGRGKPELLYVLCRQ